MPPKIDEDATPSIKLLRVFRKLLLNGQKHFQGDLASEFQCSAQTIIRIMAVIESVIGMNFESGLENRRRWYRIKTRNPFGLSMECEELRYLTVCRDLASHTLPEQILARVDDTIFNLSMHLSEQGRGRGGARLRFYSKGRIDYSPYFGIIEQVIDAIEEKKLCSITYKAVGRKEPKTHVFAPNFLLSMNQALYLAGAIIVENEEPRWSNLAVHRVKECVILPETFKIDFPPLSENMFGLPWHEPKNFRIRFREGKAAEYVAERIWSDDQDLEFEEDGSLTLRIRTRSEEELKAWARSFGEEILDFAECDQDE